ncbi:MAG: hypothetical protein HMLKMBBP_03109 [Planctomycetes bacterium]|nr:hypothetical protein [Planctomycetota bacterium]
MECGPGVRVTFRIADPDGASDEPRIDAAAFETVRFEDARGPASALCRALLGATVAQAAAATLQDVAAWSGLAPASQPVRTVHYAKSMALVGILGRGARQGPHVTCTCFHVPTEAIRAAVRSMRLGTVEEIGRAVRAGTGCGSCRPELEKLLGEPPATS